MKRTGLFWYVLLSTTILIFVVPSRIDGTNINISENVIGVNIQALASKQEINCQFPFIFLGVSYTECTTVDDPDNKPWCSTKTDENNNHIWGEWKYCAVPANSPENAHETETTIIQEDTRKVITSTAQYITKGKKLSATKDVICETATEETNTIPKTNATPKTLVTQEVDGTMVKPCSFSTIQKYWPHPRNCNMFIHCTPEGPVDMFCPQGTSWSTTLFFCIHTANTKCIQEVATSEALPLNTEDNSCQCGIANRERIIGGAEVGFARKYPWQISLQFNEQHRCGGSIINDRWILTAAHCLYISLPDNIKFGLENPLTVVVGEHIHSSLDDDHGTFTKEYSIKQYSVHPYYQHQVKVLNDFGLLEVTEPIVFGNTVRPVCLPQDNMHLYANKPGITLGWGKTSDDKITGSDTLKELKVTIHSLDNCKKWHDNWIFGSTAHPSFICASGDSGSNICSGDSGGPLMVFDDDLKRYVLVGVTSFGKAGNETHSDCDHPDFPAVYARVTEELIWINEISSNGKKCD